MEIEGWMRQLVLAREFGRSEWYMSREAAESRRPRRDTLQLLPRRIQTRRTLRRPSRIRVIVGVLDSMENKDRVQGVIDMLELYDSLPLSIQLSLEQG